MKHSPEAAAKPRAKKLPEIYWKTLLADDVRMEVDKKVSVIGLYADDKIVVNMPADLADPSPAAPVAIEGLCILSVVFNLATATEVQMNLLDPAGRLVAKGSMKLPACAVNNSISRFHPLPISEFGTWKLEYHSDSLHLEYFFEVLRGPILESPLPAKTAKTPPKRRIRL